MRNWRVGSSLYGEVLDTKTVRAGDPTTFNYSGSFDNTNPDATEYDIQLNKSGVGPVGTEKVIYPDACEVPCPDPTVSITEVSNRNPASGEVVNFTGYASGGTGHSIVSRKWDFGDGTSSTLSNPSKSWKNTTGSPKIYTVRFTATNDCGKSRSTSTTVTVASEVVKTGIEIQFPASLNGKQLIAHGAVSTILDLWWTGPAVHGGPWTKGRATWDNIDSSKKYHISVGDACKESPLIDDVYPEYPDLCAGTFGDGDDVVILVRNPGFDFRVYGSGNVHTLSGTSFNVLYLGETSGDIITTAFTGKVCGWLGIPSGTECDAFWAEFYDPIFVANYMSIASTGEDMFGNARTLSWIDHVAFVASLVGSLPVFNLFPFAGITRNLLVGVKSIIQRVPSLVGDELARAGGALADICTNAPEVIGKMTSSEIDELRAALVKVYGDVVGNKYVDDALAAVITFVKKYHDILERFRTGAIDDVPVETINEMLDHGKTTPADILDLMDSFSPNELRGLISKLQDGTHKHPTGMMFESIGTYRGSVSPGNIPKYVTDSCDIASEAMKAPSPAAAADIPKTAQDFVFDSRPLAAEAGDTINDDLLESMREFAGQPHTAWKDKAISFVDRKIIRWFDKIKGAPKKKVKYDDHMSRFAKWKAIYADLEDWQKFTTMTMLAWGCYEVASFFGGYVIPKILGVFPEQASWRQIRHNENMESFAWMCKAAHDEGRTDDLKEAIGLLRNEIAEAEKHLADNATEFKISKVYNGFLNALEGAKLTLSIAEGWLVEMVPVGYIRCTSNEAFFYVDLDGSPAGFSYANKEILLSSVPVGNHVVKIHKSGSGECEKTITVGEGITSEFYCQLGIVCTPPVPSITAPGKAKVKEGVRFTGSATTESAITYWHWDFDDGTDSHVQSPSHLFWSAGTYTVKLTVTDDCGTAETTHTIVIEGEAPIPPIIPPEEEAATIDVKTPIDARTGGAIVFPIKPYIFVDGKSIDETAPYPIPFGGFGELPVKDPTTVTVKAAGYQDKSETFHLTDKYFESWVPYMDPVGYVPPVGHPIDFYIPENASLTVTPITTVSRLVAGIRSIGRR
jgi:PKD repeat protein